MLALEASLKSELPRETGLSAHQVEAGLSREQRAFRGALRRQCEGECRASRERFRKRPWAQTEAFTARAKAGVLPAYGLESRDKGVLATLRSLLLHEVAHFSSSAHARLKFLRERLDEALARLGMPPADLRALVQHHPTCARGWRAWWKRPRASGMAASRGFSPPLRWRGKVTRSGS